jgi:hypothetical protein
VDVANRPVWFVGDLDDPWVASLADALPAGSRLFRFAGDLPEDWPEVALGNGTPPRAVVLHRTSVSRRDAERLSRLRTNASSASVPGPRIILCVGPHVRHAELEEWSARNLVDAIVLESTARDTLGRHLATAEGDLAPCRLPGPRTAVSVVSASFELRHTLADACSALGYPPEPACDWSQARPSGPAVWDVPVLEADWPRALARRAGLGPVVVLLGFASRKLVGLARANGASACLEVPFDLLDLGYVLDRITAPRGDLGHPVPPPPHTLSPWERVPEGRVRADARVAVTDSERVPEGRVRADARVAVTDSERPSEGRVRAAAPQPLPQGERGSRPGFGGVE